jgi:hypothetical protein
MRFATAIFLIATTTLATEIRPLLKKHCLDCHNADKRKGDVDLTHFGSPEGDEMKCLRQLYTARERARHQKVEKGQSPRARIAATRMSALTREVGRPEESKGKKGRAGAFLVPSC